MDVFSLAQIFKFTLQYDFIVVFFFKDFIYLFFRERGREGQRGRETSMYGCLSRGSHWGAGLLGTWPATQACALTVPKPVMLWFTARAQSTELHQPGPGFVVVIMCLSC